MYQKLKSRMSGGLLLTTALGLLLAWTTTAQAQLPATGRVDRYAGVNLSGQCVPNARALGKRIWNRELPLLGAKGVAANLWTMNTPGFAKRDRVRNGQVHMPPVNSFVVWSTKLGGTGHVAMVVGSVDGTKRTVRVVDTNWGNDGRGQIHDISVNDSRILGYLVRQ